MEKKLQTKMTYSFYPEESELNTIQYRLSEVRGYYPERTIKGYNAVLEINRDKYTVFELMVDHMEYLDEIIEFLNELRFEWKKKTEELQNTSTKP